MRILANENFPGDAIDALRRLGHDVFWVRMEAPGSADEDVLERAQAESRIVATFDKDFGELAFRFGLPADSGVILFRIRSPSPRSVVRTIVAAFSQDMNWNGHFAVVEEHRIRLKPLPKVGRP